MSMANKKFINQKISKGIFSKVEEIKALVKGYEKVIKLAD